MAEKNKLIVEGSLEVDDKGIKTLNKNIGIATKGAEELGRKGKKAGDDIGVATKKAASEASGLKEGFNKAAKAVSIVAAISYGVRKLSDSWDLAKETATGYNEAANSAAIVMRSKGYTEEQIAANEELAGSLQNVGVVGDDAALAISKWAASAGLSSKEVTNLTPLIADLTAKQYGLASSAAGAEATQKAYNQALMGRTKGLEMMGVKLTDQEKNLIKVGKAAQRNTVLTKALERSVGGYNETLGKTKEGQAVIKANAVGDAYKALGQGILKSTAMTDKVIMNNMATIQEFANTVGVAIAQVTQTAVDLLNFMQGSSVEAEALKKVIIVTTGAIVTYNTVMAISGVVTKAQAGYALALAAATNIATAAQWAFNVAATANPVALVIMGVVTAAAILYNTIDGVKEVVDNTFAAFMKFTGLSKIFGGEEKEIDVAVNKSVNTTTTSTPIAPATNVSPVPAYASGTTSAAGGTALVGEQGPELVEIPKGSIVHNTQSTNKLMGSGVVIQGDSISLSYGGKGNSMDGAEEAWGFFESKLRQYEEEKKKRILAEYALGGV